MGEFEDLAPEELGMTHNEMQRFIGMEMHEGRSWEEALVKFAWLVTRFGTANQLTWYCG